MGFDMADADPLLCRDPHELADLLDDEALDVGQWQRQRAPAEAAPVGKGGMGPEGEAAVAREARQRPHRAGIAGMAAAGDVEAGERRGQVGVGPEARGSVRGGGIPLADVAIEIDRERSRAHRRYSKPSVKMRSVRWRSRRRRRASSCPISTKLSGAPGGA